MKIFNYLFYITLYAGLAACVPSVELDSDLEKTKHLRGEFVQFDQETADDYFKNPKIQYLDQQKEQFDAVSYMKNYLKPDYWDTGFSICEDCISAESRARNSSTTNAIEKNVAEADTMKTDGDFIYTAENNLFKIYQHNSAQPNTTSFVNLDDTIPSLDVLRSNILGLNDDNVMINARSVETKDIHTNGWWFPIVESSTHLLQLDVSDKSNSKIANRGSFKANFVSSRIIGNTLYYVFDNEQDVSLYDVYLALNKILGEEENLQEIYDDEDLRQDFAAMLETEFTERIAALKSDIIQQGSASSHLYYNYNDQKIALDNRCYNRSSNSVAQDSFVSIRYIVALDVDDLSLKHSMCYTHPDYDYGFVGPYISETGFYITSAFNKNAIEGENIWAGNERNALRIEYFNLGESSIEHRGSAEVVGDLFWPASRQFYMSERDGYLRLFTQVNSGERENAYLHTLKINPDSLSLAGQLPNLKSRSSIGGKVSTARFVGNKGYLATQENQSRLTSWQAILFSRYKFSQFDLNIANSPRLLGAVNKKTDSEYLHPLSDDNVLAISKNVFGVNVTTIDNSNSEPEVLASRYIAGARTRHTLDYNYQRICSLNKENKVRVSMLLDQPYSFEGLPYWASIDVYDESKDHDIVLSTEQLSIDDKGIYDGSCLFIHDAIYTLSGSPYSDEPHVLKKIEWPSY